METSFTLLEWTDALAAVPVLATPSTGLSATTWILLGVATVTVVIVLVQLNQPTYAVKEKAK